MTEPFDVPESRGPSGTGDPGCSGSFAAADGTDPIPARPQHPPRSRTIAGEAEYGAQDIGRSQAEPLHAPQPMSRAEALRRERGTDAAPAQHHPSAVLNDDSFANLAPASGTAAPMGPPDSGDEAERASALRRMRILATSLLGVAALIFLAMHVFTDVHGVWGFIAAGAEAAMVGAIADWFAVTALFRHPLGLPIPHTAIIPRKKDVLGESLSTFVALNFLKASTVAPKIRSAQVTRRVGEWLEKPANQEILVDRAGQGLEYVLGRIDDGAVESLTRNVLVPKLVATHKAPVLGTLLNEIVEDGAHRRLVDLVVAEAYTWLEANPQVVDDLVAQRTPEWMPRFVNDTVSNRLRREVLQWVADVRDNRRHKARQALDRWLLELAEALRSDTSIARRTEVVLDDLLREEGVVHSVLEIWGSLKRLLRSAVVEADGEVHERIRSLLSEFAHRLTTDDAFAARIDNQVATAAGDLAESFGTEIASVISDTIKSWDAREASDKIELYVGKDLQYIRINGTVIGALVGIVIHAVTLALPA